MDGVGASMGDECRGGGGGIFYTSDYLLDVDRMWMSVVRCRMVFVGPHMFKGGTVKFINDA